ncbi:PREDICTED: CD44 antigen isoform X3 [Chinchilla lanigera]|uniref:CD44 antigen isoform X3 n=1 Tax=Chinchilla lanigera TaxID=34839 RepID=UPI00038EDD64|nr:PREDICTED: CD44 antigen isoform X3 [Chinchilla lanigera]
MDKFWWRAAWGLCLVQLSLAQIDLNITCRYAGVFHVEKNGRYSISRTEAADLCKAFNSTLPTMAQMEQALRKGFETCRYGFIEGHVVIPRITPNAICAANNTGVYILTSNTSHYDTYCFNASAPLDKEDCASVTDLPNSFAGQVTITIVNRDGTRYSKKGEYRTHQEDINPNSTIDDDVSGGYPGERSTSGGYSIFHTHLPTSHPTPEEAITEVYGSTSTDSNTMSTGWEPSEDNEEDRDKHLSFSGSGIDDDEDFISSTTWAAHSSTTEETAATQKEQWFESGWHGEYPHTPREDPGSTAGTTAHNSHPSPRMTTQSQEDISWTEFFDPVSHPMRRGHQTEKTMDVDTSHSTSIQPTADPNTDLVEDLDRIRPLSVTTQQSDSQSFSTSHGELEEDKDHPTTSTLTTGNRHPARGGRRGGNLPENSTTSLESYTPPYSDTKENGTIIPVTPANTGAFGEIEVTVVGERNSDVDHPLPGDQDSSIDPDRHSHTTSDSKSDGHSSGTQSGANTTSAPIRRPQIPEWLIILASLLALALILAVCIAVNSRRRCGQKKKLVINNGNGKVEDRKPSGINGEASKSQEMVHLVNKEPSETPDQFMTADETRNLQNVDMKIGV